VKSNESIAGTERNALREQWAVWSELVKLRLTAMVLVTATMGFYLASTTMDWALLFRALVGTGLVACGAAILNQYLEKDFDAKMPRTADRPIPAGRIRPETALLAGGAMGVLGLLYLAAQVNLLTSVIGAVTLVTYIAVYTPLKRVTSLNTLIGAVPGALPPLMGWTAARANAAGIAPEAWSLVAILFFWQLPHFLAIAWMYREDYEGAGFRMISEGQHGREHTGRFALISCLALVPAALAPFFLHISGSMYLGGALALSLGFAWLSLRFSREMTLESAKRLFYYSLLYLPLLLGLMVCDRGA